MLHTLLYPSDQRHSTCCTWNMYRLCCGGVSGEQGAPVLVGSIVVPRGQTGEQDQVTSICT